MKKIACLAVFFGLCVLVVAVGAAEMRTWTSGGGKFTTEAELVEVSKDGLFVTLRKKIDGKEIQIVIERLSQDDQEYIKAKQEKVSQPPAVQPTQPTAQPKRLLSRKDYIDAILSRIDNEDEKKIVQRYLNNCDISYDNKSIDCAWKNVRDKKSIHLEDYRFPLGYGEDWARLSYQACIHVYPETSAVSGYLSFDVWSENWEFIDGSRVYTVGEKDELKARFPKVEWKRRVTSVGNRLSESGTYPLMFLTQDVIDALTSGKKCGINLGGNRYTCQPFPVSDSKNKGIKACLEAYNVLKKYYNYEW